MAKRYVARVVVESIETPDPDPVLEGRRRVEPPTTEPRRRKATVANIVVGNADLESLKVLVGRHLDLVEDGGDVEVDR